MRRPAEVSVRPGAEKSKTTSIPSPTGGLNARDSITEMPAADAVILENWFPTTTSVQVRYGYSAWNTFTGTCQTIMVYTGLTSTKVFPCVKNGGTYSVYDGTSAGALSLAVVGGAPFTITGVAITGVGGQFSCSASSQPLTVNQRVTISGTFGGTGAITGYVDPTTYLISVTNGSTTFTLTTTSGGAIVTAVGTPTGLTYTIANIETLTNTRFDYINFGTAGGQYLIAVNGSDNPLQYDGAAWTVSGLTGGTPANYQSITVYQKRIFVFTKNTFEVRYWPVETIAGASAAALNLGSLFKLGGHMAAIISLTDDGGGLIDYIGFVSSEGEVVAFTGSDPSSSSTWALAAHFRVGRPVTTGNRTWAKWGTDALLLCTDGVYPLRKAVVADRKIEGLSVSDKIRNLINTDIALYGDKYGWQVLLHSSSNKLIVNIPIAEDSASYQYVMNTQTGAWCKFTGWTAFTFEVAQDTLYMGGSGTMVKADTTRQDGAMNITAQAKQAFNYFGTRGRVKHANLLRPIITSDRSYHLAISCDTDFKAADPVVYREVNAGSGDPWGGIWDTLWSGSSVVSLNWYGVYGVGRAVAPRVNVQNDGATIQWSATDVVGEIGGIL